MSASPTFAIRHGETSTRAGSDSGRPVPVPCPGVTPAAAPWFDGIVRLIDAEQIRNGLDMLELIAALREGHRRELPQMERVFIQEPGTPNSFLAWNAWESRSMIAVKLVTIFPENPGAAIPAPSVQAVVTAFDGTDGTPRAVIDGTELTYWKTAASSGLAADILAPSEPEILLMVGAGGLAPYLVMAHLAVRPSIERVLVWNRTRSRAEAMIGHPLIRAPVQVVDDLDAALGVADVISAATSSSRPLIGGDLLRPGCHVDLVGGFTPEMREADDAAITRATVFVDAAMFTIDHCGDISAPIASGVLGRSDVVADLFGLCRAEHPGRTGPEEITLYKSGGGAHLDLMATRHLLEAL